MRINNMTWLPFCILLLTQCQGQQPVSTAPAFATADKASLVGGPFENGEFMFYGIPKDIDAVDTSAGWGLPAPKLLLTGIVYKRDGKTPAPGVVLYYYQTDHTGIYADKPGLDRRVVKHGYIRGWVKTDAEGRYAMYTTRPAPYRDGSEAAHIHPSILEPGIETPYYIDDFVFDDDPLLTSAKRKAMENRGGSGILRLVKQGDLLVGERNIILGLNIPGYPD
jgi:protocatechuate 3,4-dioxygenase beta subunit